jgi:hypothetical protein
MLSYFTANKHKPSNSVGVTQTYAGHANEGFETLHNTVTRQPNKQRFTATPKHKIASHFWLPRTFGGTETACMKK